MAKHRWVFFLSFAFHFVMLLPKLGNVRLFSWHYLPKNIVKRNHFIYREIPKNNWAQWKYCGAFHLSSVFFDFSPVWEFFNAFSNWGCMDKFGVTSTPPLRVRFSKSMPSIQWKLDSHDPFMNIGQGFQKRPSIHSRLQVFVNSFSFDISQSILL